MSHWKDAILVVGSALEKALGMEQPPPRLTEAQVLKIARAAAEEQGWPWLEGEEVLVSFTPGGSRGAGEWSVLTYPGGKGGNVKIVISDQTRAVLRKGFMPR